MTDIDIRTLSPRYDRDREERSLRRQRWFGVALLVAGVALALLGAVLQ